MLGIAAYRVLYGLNWYAEDTVAVATIGIPGRPVAVPPPLPPGVADRASRILEMAGLRPGEAIRAETPVDLVRAVADRLLIEVEAPGSVRVRPRVAASARIWDVALPVANAATTGLALKIAVDVAAAALLHPEPVPPRDLAADVERLRETWAPWKLDLDHAEIADAADRLGIPWKRVSYLPRAVQLGEGRGHRRMLATVTDATAVMGARLSDDKAATSLRLMQQGIPVPRQRIAEGTDDVFRAAEAFGFPVVVKPRDGRWNRGVSVVYFPEDVEQAVADAGGHGSGMLVESWVPGREYRILVAAGEVCAAHEREAPTVIADGRTPVAELVRRANADPRQLTPAGAWGAPIVLTDMALAHLRWQGLTVEDVPAPGRRIGLSPLPFRKHGAIYRDVGDRVHPENAALAVRVARLLGLDVAGIDIRLVDIARSWRDGPAGICEVNVGPGLDNIAVTGRARGIDVPGRLIDLLHPPVSRRRMPAILVTGVENPEAVGEAVARRLAECFGWTVGLATPAGARVGPYARPPIAHSGPHPALELIAEDPEADACVAAFGLGTLLDHGLGRNRWDLAVLGTAALEGRTQSHLRLLDMLLRDAGCTIVDGWVSPSEIPAAVARRAASLTLTG